MKIEQVIDTVAESKIKEFGFGIEIKNFKLKEIDISAGLRNHARMIEGGLDQQMVCQFALDMENGAKFPMPVLFDIKGKALPAGGNHRLNAYARTSGADLLEIPCYVIKTDDEQVIDLLPRALNTADSLKYSKQERIAHARYASEKFNMDNKVAEKMFGLINGELSRYKRIEEARKQLEKAGTPGISKLKASIIEKASAIKNINVRNSYARLIISNNISHTEAIKIYNDVKSGSTELEQMSCLAKYEKGIGKISKNGTLKNNEHRKFLVAITSLENLSGNQKLCQFQITIKDEIKQIRLRCLKLSEWLRNLR